MPIDVREKVRLLPHSPGVYQFLDAEGTVLYVGKATSLRNRVGSYFAKDHPDGKTRLLVGKVADLRTIVTDTPFDALLLENSLIKQYRPRYNILMRDDKSYPWIRIRNEPFPRIEGMRNPVDDGSEHIGPFASPGAMRTALKLVHQLYKLRTCNYDLSPANIAKGKFKRCLEWHMGNCRGPCEGLQPKEDYDAKVAMARQVLKGRTGGVMKLLRERMAAHAERLEFEEAEEARRQLEQLERYQARSVVVSPAVGDVDVFALARDTQSTYVNYMRVIDGAVVQGITVELKRRLDEPNDEVLQYAIAELRQRFRSSAPEAITPMDPGLEMPGLRFTVPQRGDKRHLLEMGERNARYFMLEKQKQEALTDPGAAAERILQQIKQDLRLSEVPRHIECFDNRNTQGTDPVSACVVFKDARPSKRDYRHFNIRTVQGPDDFATMEEALERRYSRLITEGGPLPQLVVVDGGKGQLHSAMNVFDRLGLRGKVALIGIAERLEEIYFPGDPAPLHIDKRSSSLKLIQHMRDEAHRFGITHHRGRRNKRVVRTALEDIPGIGPGTAKKLLARFGSVQGVRGAAREDVAAEVGEKKAEAVRRGLGAQRAEG